MHLLNRAKRETRSLSNYLERLVYQHLEITK
jgi:hypothetical protein